MAYATDIELDAVFGALGNRTRRSLITRLGAGDATVSELAEPFDMTLPAISKHLLVLENAGLITRTREGKARRCALREPGLERAESWLTDRRKHWTGSLDSLAAYLEHDPHPDTAQTDTAHTDRTDGAPSEPDTAHTDTAPTDPLPSDPDTDRTAPSEPGASA